jgi:hypothetical protein
VGFGQRCDQDGNFLCPPDGRCALTAGTTNDFTCVALKKVGEPCGHPDDCVPAAQCTAGVCSACR